MEEFNRDLPGILNIQYKIIFILRYILQLSKFLKRREIIVEFML